MYSQVAAIDETLAWLAAAVAPLEPDDMRGSRA